MAGVGARSNVCRAGVVSIPRRAKIIHCQWYAYSTGVNIHKLCWCIAFVFETRPIVTSFAVLVQFLD